MKYLITTIAAVLLIGCGSTTDHSGTYTLKATGEEDSLTLELNPDGSFTGSPPQDKEDRMIGTWKAEGELLVCEGTTEKRSRKIIIKFNITTWKLDSLNADGNEMPKEEIDKVTVSKHGGKTGEELKAEGK